jgi:Signal transduction histidine kinase
MLMHNSSLPDEVQLCSSKEAVPQEIQSLKYILTWEEVVAQQDYICGKLCFPTTIHVFRNDSTQPYGERIDSLVSGIALRSSCDILRRCIDDNGEHCKSCDGSHAKIFHGLPVNDMENSIRKKISETRKKWDKKYENSYYDPDIITKFPRPYLQYRCPMLGYLELMFPIFYEDVVIAVLVVGQIRLDDEVENEAIRNSKENFFEKEPHIFENYFAKGKLKYPCKEGIFEQDKLKKYMIEKSFRGIAPEYPEVFEHLQGMQIPYEEDALSKTRLDIKINLILNWLDGFEALLISTMNHKRVEHVSGLLNSASSEFYAQCGMISQNQIDPIWENVHKFIQQVAQACDLSHIAVFGTNSIRRRETSELDCVAEYPESKRTRGDHTSSVFRPNRPRHLPKGPLDSDKAGKLFHALGAEASDQQDLKTIIYQPALLSVASVAMLIEYRSKKVKLSIEKTMINALYRFTAFLSAQLIAVFEYQAREQLEETLGLYQHEYNNLSASLNRAIHKYLGNDDLKDFSDSDIKVVYEDASRTLEMFRFLSRNMGMLHGTPIKPEFKYLFIYQDLLIKWQKTMEFDAADKGCVFVYEKTYYKLYTDPKYTELVVYNLFSNAVKYAYSGTKIYFHCGKTIKRTRSLLTVTNFAFNIQDSSKARIFDMGYRAPDAKLTWPEGNGIGLYIVKKVMKILYGSIKLCEPQLLSLYNIPILHALCTDPERYEKCISAEEYLLAREEYNNLKGRQYIDSCGKLTDGISLVISTNERYRPTKQELRERLKTRTYQIRFEVTF